MSKRDTRETTPDTSADTVRPAFSDEGDFTKIRTDYNFYSPSYEVRNANGQTEVRRDPEHAPDGLITLRGIPLARRMRPARQKTNIVSGRAMLVYDNMQRPVYEDPRPYFVLVLTAPTLVKDLEGEWKTAQPGEMVWLDQRAGQAILEEYLPDFPLDHAGKPDDKEMPHAVYEMIIRPIKLDHYTDRRSGEARKAWRFEQMQKRRNPREVWPGQLESVRQVVTYLPPATPEFDPEEHEKLKQLPM